MRTNRLFFVVGIGFAGVLILCLMLCAGVFLATFQKMDAALSPKVDALFRAIDAETFANTYSTGTTPEFRETMTPEQYDQLGQTLKTRLGLLQSKKLSHIHFEQQNAKTFADAVYDAQFDKGPATIEVKFEKIEGEWLLASFHVTSPELETDQP